MTHTQISRHCDKQNMSVKPIMLLLTTACWILLNVCYAPQYVQIVKSSPDAGVTTIVLIALSWIVITSLYASFHVVSFLFSLVITLLGHAPARDYGTTPHVAMLYVCM